MWYITRILSALLFLFSVVFTIPLAFDVGGRTCGLAFSLSLSAFYFFYSALRLATPDRSRLRYALVNTIAASQMGGKDVRWEKSTARYLVRMGLR